MVLVKGEWFDLYVCAMREHCLILLKIYPDNF